MVEWCSVASNERQPCGVIGQMTAPPSTPHQTGACDVIRLFDSPRRDRRIHAGLWHPTCRPNAEQSATEARSITILRDAFDAWAAQTGSVFDILSPDIIWTIPGSGPVTGTYTGSESFLEDASRPLFSRPSEPLIADVHNICAVDDHVIIRFDGSDTTNVGAPYTNRFIWIFRMEDGLVVAAETVLDLITYHDVIDSNEPRAD